ncbi:hypothetical protein, partial [Klebsiella pneumoniae]
VKVGLAFFLFVELVPGTIFSQNQDSPENWPAYNRTYNGERYSPLKQITTANVKQLRLLHSFDLGRDISSLQTGPIVV